MMNPEQLISRKPNRRNGFTLVELMMALIISVIILGAVVTFTSAVGSTNDAFGDTSQKQAQVRYATLRISELLKHCKLILAVNPKNFAIWRSDDNNDGVININELVYIDVGPQNEYLRICELYSSSNPTVNLSSVNTFASGWWGAFAANMTFITLIPHCSNVQMYLDPAAPWTRFVSISFDLEENDVVHHYQINATLRRRPDNLLDDSGNLK